MAETRPVILCISASAMPLARKMSLKFSAEIHGLRIRVPEAEVLFDQFEIHLRQLFRMQVPIIGICSSAILIRLLAPELSEKRSEPPVLAVAEDGSVVVPLLGGHRGANRLATQLAEELGGTAALTTAGDLRFGIALDDPPDSLLLANPEATKDFMARLLAGEGVHLEGEHQWLLESSLPWDPEALLSICVSEKKVKPSAECLVYHPKVLALGVGCERHCKPSELEALVSSSLNSKGIAPQSLAGVFSLDLKADEEAVQELAGTLGLPARFFSVEELEAQKERLENPSDKVFTAVGCHGVAEGAALAAAGEMGELMITKQKSLHATCAVARAKEDLDTFQAGRPRGILSIVGTGPGAPRWRLYESIDWLRQASDWVGYRLYLQLLEDLHQQQMLHEFAIGKETERVIHALELAAEGKNVALVCSGDPGIYALSTLVYEVMDRENRADWCRVEVRVSPGITAMQAAAAKIGAPLGHDFCAISLSDLMTPKEVILKRIEAAAESDLVIAFYNPVSLKRTELLGKARECLLKYRNPATPVVLARNLGRKEETIRIIDLKDLRHEDIDMQTLVIAGSSQTLRYGDPGQNCRLFTPRGYEEKLRNHDLKEGIG